MGLYSNIIFPRFLDYSMKKPMFTKSRKDVLAEVSGEVLEIGFGTGLNLPHYPDHIQKITTVDVSEGVNALAQKRIQDSKITIDNRVLSGESLPMDDESFDSVVSTWTMCSIPNINQALQEMYRVLKTGGRLFFIEHGLSDEPNIQKWQHRLTPIQKKIGEGCHLNRDIKSLIEEQPFEVELQQFYMESFPKIAGFMYQGIATKK